MFGIFTGVAREFHMGAQDSHACLLVRAYRHPVKLAQGVQNSTSDLETTRPIEAYITVRLHASIVQGTLAGQL